MRLDKIDKKILIILQRNAKITNSKLSKEIGLSPAPTLERVRKLESNGIISCYHAKLDKSKLGLGVSTFVMVSLKVHNKKNLLSFLDKINIGLLCVFHKIFLNSSFLLNLSSKRLSASSN